MYVGYMIFMSYVSHISIFILTPKQMIQGSPVAYVEVNAGKTLNNLPNEVK